MNGLVDHDALVRERKGMSRIESEKHYVRTEMLDPLVGGVILGGEVVYEDDRIIPALRVMVKGRIYLVVIAADDELNDGGRLIIEPEESLK